MQALPGFESPTLRHFVFTSLQLYYDVLVYIRHLLWRAEMIGMDEVHVLPVIGNQLDAICEDRGEIIDHLKPDRARRHVPIEALIGEDNLVPLPRFNHKLARRHPGRLVSALVMIHIRRTTGVMDCIFHRTSIIAVFSLPPGGQAITPGLGDIRLPGEDRRRIGLGSILIIGTPEIAVAQGGAGYSGMYLQAPATSCLLAI